MKNLQCRAALLGFALWLCQADLASPAGSEGLATPFVDVGVVQVPLGKPWHVQDDKGRSLVLQNLGAGALQVSVEPLMPTAQELRAPTEAIPDLGWVRIEPKTLTIPAGATAECQVILTVPRRWKYRHKLYQVMIWSRSAPVATSAMTIGAGLKSRLRFKTVP
jgi:hypothetical protein